MTPQGNCDCVLSTVDPLTVRNDSGQGDQLPLCEHNCGPEGKSKPSFLTFHLHPAHYYKFDFFKFRVLECSQRHIFQPCMLTERSIRIPEAESSVTNACEMCEDETLFCNYTLPTMEESLSCELPTWGRHLKVLPCISNSRALTGGRRCFHTWNGNYFRIISMQHFLLTAQI